MSWDINLRKIADVSFYHPLEHVEITIMLLKLHSYITGLLPQCIDWYFIILFLWLAFQNNWYYVCLLDCH